ncbi:DUF4376 domain-containing protein [Pararhodobacter sp. SW119]|uniref:DUF4376 domain-containing protein n=1 Tax=Pararhodobacter sp. SW119 TaxID=2780075 RepID=UPI001AE08313|nr:DUF4376 domain-containing protein [Pararhodobacter sp. SW119]
MPKIDFAAVITADDKASAAAVALRERIRQRRDRAMNAGVRVGGRLIHTDDISQQRILGAAVAVMRDPSLVINWKTADGAFVPLDAGAVLAAADAVRAHVQSCYEREAVMLAAFNAGGEPNIEVGWPG